MLGRFFLLSEQLAMFLRGCIERIDRIGQNELVLICFFHRDLRRLFQGAQLGLERVGLRRLEFGTIDAILGAVAAGLGITLMPRVLVGPTWRGGRIAVHRLPPAEARVQTLFVRRRDMLCSSALAAFQKHIVKGRAR